MGNQPSLNDPNLDPGVQPPGPKTKGQSRGPEGHEE